MDLEASLRGLLKRRSDLSDSEWSWWEHRTLNLHRGFLHWRNSDPTTDAPQMSARVREQVRTRLRISWWRGFAFGVLVESPTLPVKFSDIQEWIDVRAQRRGTWQWVIFACPPARVAIGVHTWVEGYLSPVYEDLLNQYRGETFAVGSFHKDKDQLLAFLDQVRDRLEPIMPFLDLLTG